MRYPDLYVAGTGSWYPKQVPVDEAIADGRYPVELQRLTGQQRVAVAEPGVDTQPEMAVRAGVRAVARSGLAPDRFGLLLHATATHNGLDGWNAASYVQHRVLDGHGLSFEVGQLSNSAAGSLELACAWLTAHPDRPAALITAADQFALPAWDRWASAPPIFVFADGASALVVARGTGFGRLAAVVTVADPELELLHRGTLPFSPDPSAGHPVGFIARILQAVDRLGLDLEDAKRRMADGVRRAATAACAEAGVAVADVDHVVVPHFGREALHEQCLDPLGIDVDRTTWRFARQIGHAGCTDPLGGLDHLVDAGRLAAGERVLVLSVGGGFNCTAAVVEVVERPEVSVAPEG